MKIKIEEFKWMNIFVRDFFLILIMAGVNYLTGFRSWWVGFVTGALIVFVSWQFTDYLNFRKLYNEIRT